MKHYIQKNKKFTDKTISVLLEKNGNVFYLASTNATFSTVWTYSDDTLEIFELAKGKVFEQASYPDSGIFKYQIPSFKELHSEFKECGYELDGDVFGYRIKRDAKLEQQDLPIGIECFTKLKYKSELLNKVIKDINTYKMWDVLYE
jgi:hypothetical protein